MKAHYEHYPEAESKVGIMITREALKHRPGFLATSLCQSLLREYYGFAADIALGLRLKLSTSVNPYTCDDCGQINQVEDERLREDGFGEFFWHACGHLQDFD